MHFNAHVAAKFFEACNHVGDNFFRVTGFVVA